MRIALLFLCCLINLKVYAAQGGYVDSLQNKLRQKQLPDTLRIDLLTDLAFYYASIQPKSGIKYADEAIHLASVTKDTKRLVSALNYKGLNYYKAGADSTAVYWFSKAIKKARDHHITTKEATALHNLALLYTDQGKYQQALSLRQHVNQLLAQNQDNKRLCNALNSTGAIYLQLADYPTALHYFLEANKTATASNTPFVAALSLENIGLVYKKMGDFTKALDYYQQAKQQYETEGAKNSFAISNILNNMAVLYDEKQETEKAISLLQQALQMDKGTDNQRGLVRGLTNMATVYKNAGQYRKAFSFIYQADSLFQLIAEPNAQSTLLATWAEALVASPDSILQSIGLSPAKRNTLVLDKAKKALQLAKEHNLQENEMLLTQLLGDLYENTGRYQQALSHYRQYIQLRDTLLNEDKKIVILKKEMQFVADKKELQHQLVLQRAQAKQNLFIGIALATLLLIVLSFILYKKRSDYKQAQRELQLKANISETRLQVLRLQMNPHFIFNSLNSIAHYLLQHDVRQADYYLAKFARLMRRILDNADEKLIPLSEELDLINQYIALEQLRLNHIFQYTLYVDPAIDAEQLYVPVLILQPFVENSIWHGLSSLQQEGHIYITIQPQSDCLYCTITDNGIGRQASSDTNKRSYGLQITRERLDLLRQEVAGRIATYTINDLPTGTEVILQLPLIVKNHVTSDYHR